MKSIINGRRYDTAKAELVAVWEYESEDPEYHILEILYRAPRKRDYFLACWGGGASRYAVRRGSTWYPGERIIPITTQEAEQWKSRLRYAQEN